MTEDLPRRKKKKAWGTSGNTWASILGSVVLFNTSRWGFLSRDLWHLMWKPLPEIHMTQTFGFNQPREVQGEACEETVWP